MSDSKSPPGGKDVSPDIAVPQANATTSSSQNPIAGRPIEPTRNGNPLLPLEESTGQHSNHDNFHEGIHQKSTVEETPIEQVPPVPFGSQLGQVDFSQDGFDTKAKVAGSLPSRGNEWFDLD